MSKYKVGYTQGAFDLFHIGHLNLLNRAKEQCDHLVVGINSDHLIKQYKHKTPIIHELDRAIIVGNIKAVDEVYIINTLDKEEVLKHIPFNAIFIGSDWQNNPRWINTKEQLTKHGIDVVFLPHTDGISSTLITKAINDES